MPITVYQNTILEMIWLLGMYFTLDVFHLWYPRIKVFQEVQRRMIGSIYGV